MKQLTFLLCFLFITCTVSAQKKSLSSACEQIKKEFNGFTVDKLVDLAGIIMVDAERKLEKNGFHFNGSSYDESGRRIVNFVPNGDSKIKGLISITVNKDSIFVDNAAWFLGDKDIEHRKDCIVNQLEEKGCGRSLQSFYKNNSFTQNYIWKIRENASTSDVDTTHVEGVFYILYDIYVTEVRGGLEGGNGLIIFARKS